MPPKPKPQLAAEDADRPLPAIKEEWDNAVKRHFHKTLGDGCQDKLKIGNVPFAPKTGASEINDPNYLRMRVLWVLHQAIDMKKHIGKFVSDASKRWGEIHATSDELGRYLATLYPKSELDKTTLVDILIQDDQESAGVQNPRKRKRSEQIEGSGLAEVARWKAGLRTECGIFTDARHWQALSAIQTYKPPQGSPSLPTADEHVTNTAEVLFLSATVRSPPPGESIVDPVEDLAAQPPSKVAKIGAPTSKTGGSDKIQCNLGYLHQNTGKTAGRTSGAEAGPRTSRRATAGPSREPNQPPLGKGFTRAFDFRINAVKRALRKNAVDILKSESDGALGDVACGDHVYCLLEAKTNGRSRPTRKQEAAEMVTWIYSDSTSGKNDAAYRRKHGLLKDNGKYRRRFIIGYDQDQMWITVGEWHVDNYVKCLDHGHKGNTGPSEFLTMHEYGPYTALVREDTKMFFEHLLAFVHELDANMPAEAASG